MKKYIGFLGFLLLMLMASCDFDDDGANVRFVALQTVDAVFPDSFERGNFYQIQVTYLRPNGCTFFEGFDFKKPDLTEREVVIIGSVFEDMVCTQAVEEATATFNFEVLYEDVYYFKFWAGTDEQGNDIYLEYQVPVTP